MSVAQLGVILSAQGFVVLALELPTGGFADASAAGRCSSPSAVVNLASWGLLMAAHSFWVFFARQALQGVFRALDSGPLEAWYVDTAHADDPTVPVERALSAAGTVVGVSIAAGALHLRRAHRLAPRHRRSRRIELPAYVALALGVVHLVASPCSCASRAPTSTPPAFRRALSSAKEAPRTVAERHAAAGVLPGAPRPRPRRGVLVVGMIAFETLNPVRLAELVGGEDRAGALLGPVSLGGVGPVRRRVCGGGTGRAGASGSAGPPWPPASSKAPSSSSWASWAARPA